jgi:NitT/TauT family transport system ATP-binding protein
LSNREAEPRGLRLAFDSGSPMTSPASPEGASLVRLDLETMQFDGVPVLGALSLEVRAGETLAITGPSGIGKSTLLRILAGLERSYRGTLHMPRRVSMVFQEPTLLPWRTALDNVRLATGVSRSESEAALEEVGLADKAAQYPSQMSLGQQRRLSLARAFASQPDVLLMDEPFVSLDPELAEDMMVLFARLRAARGLATVLVTHVVREAEMLSSRIITLAGRPATITSERQNKGAYFQLSASGVTSSKS